MIGRMKKAALAAAFVTLSPAALLIPGGASEARADVDLHVSGNVVFGSPVAVVGFSYGNPYVYGHVHSTPVYCSHGPLYWYPGQRVYAHHYPRYRYHYYDAPRYYRAKHRHFDGCGHFRSGRGHHSRGRGHHGHSGKIRGHVVVHHDD